MANQERFFVAKQNMHIMHQNIAGLINKSHLLSVCLQELEENNKYIDVLCITEHFMKSGDEQFLEVPDFHIAARYSRENSKRGGSCILVRRPNEWKEIKNIEKLSVNRNFECCAIESTITNTIIVCVYRIPKNSNMQHFFTKLEQLLGIVSKSGKKNIIITGDFNIDILKCNSVSNEFESMLLNYNYKLSVRQPTRIESMTCIDNIIHNFKKKNYKGEVVDLALSDHTAQILKCPIKITYSAESWQIERRDYSAENINTFVRAISTYPFTDIYGTQDPNEAYNIFVSQFLLLYNL